MHIFFFSTCTTEFCVTNQQNVQKHTITELLYMYTKEVALRHTIFVARVSVMSVSTSCTCMQLAEKERQPDSAACVRAAHALVRLGH